MMTDLKDDDLMNKVIVIFFMFAFLGWVWESIYCTAKDRMWANRGFLYGPVCPIYGCGGIIGLFACDLAKGGVLPQLSPWQMFAAGFAVSMILEYPTSWILEKLFHARWWDYSRVPLNINGRTSVPTSIAFGAVSIPIMKTILPAADTLIEAVPESTINLAALLLVAVFSADTTLTVSALTDFQKKVTAIDDAFQNRMTDTVEHIVNAQNHFHKKAIERIPVLMLSGQKAEIAKKLKENRLSELIARYRRSNKT